MTKEDEVEAPARIEAGDLATKADLAELKAQLFTHTTQTLVWITAIDAGLAILICAAFQL